MNDELHAFGKVYEELDGLIVIKIDDLDWVYEYGFVVSSFFSEGGRPIRLMQVLSRWREQPERLLREANRPALTSDEVRDFVHRFMPAYKTYLPELYADPKGSSSPLATIPRLVFSISATRELVDKPMEFNFTSNALLQEGSLLLH